MRFHGEQASAPLDLEAALLMQFLRNRLSQRGISRRMVRTGGGFLPSLHRTKRRFPLTAFLFSHISRNVSSKRKKSSLSVISLIRYKRAGSRCSHGLLLLPKISTSL